MSAPTVAVELDAVLADTRPVWDAFLEHLARRFAAIEPLDPSSLAHDRTRAATELDAWAASGVGDWRGQLTRFAEDHLPVYIRPDARASTALRAVVSAGTRLKVVSDAPQELVDVAASHLGLARLSVPCEGGIARSELDRDAGSLRSLAALEAYPA